MSVIEPGAVESRITDAVAENQGKRLMLEISAPEAAEIIADGRLSLSLSPFFLW